MQQVQTTVMNINSFEKDITMYFNGDMSKRFSLEHTVLVKRENKYMFISTGAVEIGDIIIERASDSNFEENPVTSIDTIDETRTVYKLDAAPTDVLIAGGIIVHNAKAF
jgi:hypothetical protein